MWSLWVHSFYKVVALFEIPICVLLPGEVVALAEVPLKVVALGAFLAEGGRSGTGGRYV